MHIKALTLCSLALGMASASILATLAPGCACTQVACEDSRTFTIELDRPIASPYVATVSLGGQEASFSCPVQEGVAPEQDGNFDGDVACSDLAIRVTLSETMFDEEPNDLHIELVSEGGEVIADADVELDYSDLEPNGALCGPSCDNVQAVPGTLTTSP